MNSDKMDLHYQQQLSALMDGDLPPDEARFLLRRLQHDTELSGRWERWQLCGDVLRGQVHAPAPAGFAERVAAAVAAPQTGAFAAAEQAPAAGRSRLRRWGGGALAASVAMVALFMVRQQVPDETPVVASAPSASPAAGAPAQEGGRMAAATQATAQAAVTAAGVAVASVPRRQDSSARRSGSATRTQQAASRNVAVARAPQRSAGTVAAAAVPVVHAIANAPASVAARDPFSNVQINPPAARPWPRAVLPQYPTGSGAFSAGYSSDSGARTFYPFEPQATEVPPLRLPDSPSRE